MGRDRRKRTQKESPRVGPEGRDDGGVVHLEIYREAGVPRLGWRAPVFSEDWQNALALAAGNTALEILEAEPHRERLLRLSRKLLDSLDDLAQKLIARGTAGPVACNAGCSHCCHQLVGATPLELLVIFDYLTRTGRDLEELGAHARLLSAKASAVTPRQRYALDQPCVFLKDGACSVYEVRPLACRGVNALDSSICRDILHNPVRRQAFWQEGQGSPGYVEPVRAALAFSAGLQLALSEVYQLTMHPIDLTRAVDLVLCSKRDALTSWLGGEDPFSAVRGGSVPRRPRADTSLPMPSVPVPAGGASTTSSARAAYPSALAFESVGPDAPSPSLGLGPADASSLLSSRWPEDNLLTGFPESRYSGDVVADVTTNDVDRLVHGFLAPFYGLELELGKMGVFTWDLTCTTADGRLLVQVPRVLDEAAPTGRQKMRVPHRSVTHIEHYRARGLGRYLLQPVLPLREFGGVPVSVLRLDGRFRTLTFGGGQARVDLTGAKGDWVVALGPEFTASVLVEVIAAIAYHYDASESGGTTICDLFLNDGDFMVARASDGSPELVLTSLRWLEGDVCPSRLLLYLTQLACYEDFQVGESLLGIPSLASNPSLAFAGLCRGRRLRAIDLGEDPDQADAEAREWISQFAQGWDGKSHARWVESFLQGGLVPAFGSDLREHWWRLLDLEERIGLATLNARSDSSPEACLQLRELEAFRSALEARILRGPVDRAAKGVIHLNDLSSEELQALLIEVGEKPDRAAVVAAAILKKWPLRSFDDLLAEVPRSKALRKVRPRLRFGPVHRAEDDTDWRTRLGVSSSSFEDTHPERSVANAEVFGAQKLPATESAAAIARFASFEAYMDAALQDERFGYYATQVAIGRGGHFTTRPEKFSPEYGRWASTLAFAVYRGLREAGQLDATAPFHLVEFGGGTGRLAADLLAAVLGPAPHPSLDPDQWSEFARALRYRIYEKSAALRGRQEALLGGRATVAEGDARRPLADLRRDFPGGLVGMVLTNEVPDAFGVHKLLVSSDGTAQAALVIPRLSSKGYQWLSATLGERILQTDRELRAQFSVAQRPDCFYLDHELFVDVLAELSSRAPEERARGLLALAVDEGYVPARHFEGLREHLLENREQLALALAVAKTGVVLYPNPHADRFIGELGAALKAGVVATIDYGAGTFQLVQSARRGEFSFRVYFDGEPFRPLPNDPYSRIGLQDLTADVNFTALALAGTKVGLGTLYYGPERDLAGPFLPELLARPDDPDLSEFLGSPQFKVLIQGRGVPPLTPSPLGTPLSLWVAEADLPQRVEQRFGVLCQALAADLEPAAQ